ncbi:MAG: glucose/sorbosone dehydrogenase-like protein [Gaiellaceae bacterium]|nr:glucose/sorbosone dehydrogenase-like protein [Gaiellaceae bacterium]
MAARVRLVGGLAAVSVCAVSLSGTASPAPPRALTVRVDARDYAFALSRRSVPAGSSVRFVVRNRGASPHDFVLKGKRTRILRRGQSQTVTVTFPRKGVFKFLCSVSGHARLGMRGSFGVSTKPPPPPKPPPPVDTSKLLALSRIGTFERPVLVTAAPGDARRLFVVEQAGTVRVVRDGEMLDRPFLDIREDVKLVSEPGLLSIAFAPDYASSGLLYAFYNTHAGNGDIRISEFLRHPADPDLADADTERILVTIVKPWENHNGGMLQFGPDGYLYASVGDGDSGVLNPPGFFAQRKDSLLGTILRIDPRHGAPYAIPPGNPFVAEQGALPEIWAYGLRNPWRFWIDDQTGSMFIADAGNAQREEVDLARLDAPGANFGWPCFEGTVPFDTTKTCSGARPPLLEYALSGSNCAVIGGVVVRDARIVALAGRYLFGDHCSGVITAVEVANGDVTSQDDLGLVVPELTSFGIDALARIYAMNLRGDVFRLDPR